MTPRQRKLFNFIRAYVDANGLPPNYPEMQAHMCLASKSGVFRILDALEHAKLIRRTMEKSRNIQLVEPSAAGLYAFSVAQLRAELARRQGGNG